jgi:hypothetical protein
MSSPLLSVVIPTYNRARYAVSCLESLLGIQDPRLQIAVHDTSGSDDLERIVAARFSDERLLYVHKPVRLTTTENHAAAMGLATGEYVCMIGDDDTIFPEAVDAAAWAARRGVEAIAPRVVANYAWPDFRSRVFGMGHAGRVYFRTRFGTGAVVDSDAALKRGLTLAAQEPDCLPKIYHGIVKRSVLERIRLQSGAYFHGASAHLSGAVGIALTIPRYLELDYPLTLPGASGGSFSGLAALNALHGDFRSAILSGPFAQSEWPVEIPGFFSTETIWAHAAVTTLQRLAPDAHHALNFMRLYGLCLIRHPRRRRETLDSFRAFRERSDKPGAKLGAALFAATAKSLLQSALRIGRRAALPTAAGGRRYFGGLSSIAEAREAVVKPLHDAGTNLERSLERAFALHRG